MLRALLVGLLLLLPLPLVVGCDDQLNMSDSNKTRRTIEECPDAVDRVHQCCPQYESYLSCNVLESWSGTGSADFNEKQSHCLKTSECPAVQKAITSGGDLCGVTFRGHKCN